MSRKKNLLLGFQTETVKNIIRIDFGKVLMKYLSHRRTCYIGTLLWKSALMEIALSVFAICQVDIGDNIHDGINSVLGIFNMVCSFSKHDACAQKVPFDQI